MRIAVITDIHGNNFALEAVLEDIAKQSVDEIVVAGDTINLLPGSRQAWEIVKALGCPILQGNHEYYIYTLGTPEAPSEWELERFQPARWTAEQFSPKEKTELQNLPWHYGLSGLLITHASERSLFDSVWPHTSDEELQTFFPTTRAGLIVRGHNHGWLERSWDKRKVVTVNSCGQPFGISKLTAYALLTLDKRWRFEKRHLEYDHAAILEAMGDEYIQNVGPLGLIFRRELETGQEQLSGFFRKYLSAVDSKEITLQTAVERYLAETA